MKGKVVGIIIAVVAIIAVVGGVFSYNANKSPKYADEAFVKSIAKGLEERWSIIDQGDSKKQTESEENKNLKEAIQAELDATSKYKTMNFKSTKLQELAVSYINALNTQKNNVNGRSEYDSSAYNAWTKAYDKRTVILTELVNKYDLKVSEKYDNELKNLIANGKDVKKSEKAQEQVDALKSALNFQQVEGENEYSRYRDYEAVLENTSDIDFDYFDVEVTLLDDDGVNLHTTYANVSNWKQGTKARFDFSTDEQFAKIELKVSWASED
ncbi:FxLYD domain-containing protein [Weissella confusa]